jgi:hypothetical protein
MALEVVARYSTLVEAEVACSALRGAGFHAEVLEATIVSMNWMYQTALGGLRVAVPESELPDATAYLADILRSRRRPHRRPRDRGIIWRLLALALGLGLLPEAGFAIIGARDRAAKGSALSLWAVVVVTITLTVLLALILIAFGMIANDLNRLFHPEITAY